MGDQVLGYQVIVIVEVFIIESIWVFLEFIYLVENFKVLYLYYIVQVYWSGVDVYYCLESYFLGLFDVDVEGNFYVIRELDIEVQVEYVFQVWVQNFCGEDYVVFLELYVLVMDENDNVFVCFLCGFVVCIFEFSFLGIEVIRLLVEDVDVLGFFNFYIVYQFLSFEFEDGVEGRVFQVDFILGSVILGVFLF